MARISKAEYPRILQMVDGEKRKVAEIAIEYGCTPANIYALLTKLRRNLHARAEIVPPDTSLPITPSLPPIEDAPTSSHADEVMMAPISFDLFGIDLPTDEPGEPAANAVARAPSKSFASMATKIRLKVWQPSLLPLHRRSQGPLSPMPVPKTVVAELPRLGDSKKPVARAHHWPSQVWPW